MESYVTSILTTSQELAAVGKPLDDELVATLLLRGLTSEYQPMKLALENSGVEITTDYIKTKLLQEESMKLALENSGVEITTDYIKTKLLQEEYNPRGKQGGGDNAFVSQHRGKDKSRRSKQGNQLNKIQGPCYICHKAADCFRNPNRPNFHKTVDNQMKNQDISLLAAMAANIESGEWYLDSGATAHMTNKRENLINFKEENVENCKLYKNNEVCIKGHHFAEANVQNGMYKLDCKSNLEKAMISRGENKMIWQNKMYLWHKRLGHLGVHNMHLLKDMAHGLDFNEGESMQPCVSCCKGKQARLPFKATGNSRANHMLELIHSDVLGKRVESLGGAKYFVTFIDDKKYTNGEFEAFLRENGIQHQLTVEHNPEMNGVAERANRTIIEKARSMLQEASLEPAYWAEAVYLKNRSPTKALSGMLPEEYWTGKKINLQHLKVFGSRAFAHIPKEKRTKWDANSKEMLMVGYCENSEAYRLINPDDPRKVEKGRNVFFIEDNKPHNRDTGSSNFEEKQSCELVIEFLLKQDKIENDKTSNESNPTDDEFSPEIDSSDDESGQSTSAEKERVFWLNDEIVSYGIKEILLDRSSAREWFDEMKIGMQKEKEEIVDVSSEAETSSDSTAESFLIAFEKELSPELLENFQKCSESGSWTSDITQTGLFEYWLRIKAKASGCQVDKPIEVQSNVITITNFKDLLSQDNSIERSNKCDRLSNDCMSENKIFSFMANELLVLNNEKEFNSCMNTSFEMDHLVITESRSPTSDIRSGFGDSSNYNIENEQVTAVLDIPGISNTENISSAENEAILQILDSADIISNDASNNLIQIITTASNEALQNLNSHSNDSNTPNEDVINNNVISNADNSKCQDENSQVDTNSDVLKLDVEKETFENIFTLPTKYLPKKKKDKLIKHGKEKAKLPVVATSEDWLKIQLGKEQKKDEEEGKRAERKLLQEKRKKMSDQTKILLEKKKQMKSKVEDELAKEIKVLEVELQNIKQKTKRIKTEKIQNEAI
ncbi:GAG-pre-integrase domain [Popillia japonica]|uniref:GAG-pre-integrase domain n=1 Tax=Popillia japonica TaxID=7064 RepID=A0AAW1JUQ4_POPJA